VEALSDSRGLQRASLSTTANLKFFPIHLRIFTLARRAALAWIGPKVIRFCGQEWEEMMLTYFALPFASSQAPCSSESEELAAFIERKPMRHLRAVVSPFTK
jgi:hypothetical protein